MKKYIWYLILVFTLFPFVILAFFNLPMGDDFYFGDIGRSNTLVSSVLYWYHNWSGRYTQAVFLTIFNPLSFNSIRFFWVPPLVVILGICIGMLVLIKIISKNTLSRNEMFSIFSAILFLLFNLMPEIGETLYWISGTYTFQTGNIFFIMFVSVMCKIYQVKNIFTKFSYTILAIILAGLCIGSNEISMLYIFGITILLLLHQIWFKKKNVLIVLILFIAISAFSYISVFAPGNLVRASATGGMIQKVPFAILESIFRGSFYLVFWLPSTIIVSLLIWEYLRKVSEKYSLNKTTNFKELLLVIMLFFAVICAGFFPSLVATGWNPPRTVAPVLIVFLFFYFGIIIHYFNFFDQYISKINIQIFQNSYLFIFLLILSFSNKHNVMNAYVDLVSLKALKYYKEVDTFYTSLSQSEKKIIYTYPINAKPLILPVRWPDNYNSLVNNELEMYFDKKVLMYPNKK